MYIYIYIYIYIYSRTYVSLVMPRPVIMHAVCRRRHGPTVYPFDRNLVRFTPAPHNLRSADVPIIGVTTTRRARVSGGLSTLHP